MWFRRLLNIAFTFLAQFFSTFRRKCLIEIQNTSLLYSFVSRSVSPFARFIPRQRIRIYPRQSWYSMPDDDDYSHLGKSLFHSRHYRVTVLRYLDEVSRGSSDRNESSSSSPNRFRPRKDFREGLFVLLFSSPRALFPQSTRDIADSKAFPQTTFLLLVFAST